MLPSLFPDLLLLGRIVQGCTLRTWAVTAEFSQGPSENLSLLKRANLSECKSEHGKIPGLIEAACWQHIAEHEL